MTTTASGSLRSANPPQKQGMHTDVDQRPTGAQHPGRQVDAHGSPAQLANPAGRHAGAATDVQAGAAALAEQVAQGPADAQGVGVRPSAAGPPPGDELCSYQSAISS
jgi:hypothetical protein